MRKLKVIGLLVAFGLVSVAPALAGENAHRSTSSAAIHCTGKSKSVASAKRAKRARDRAAARSAE